MNALRKCPNCCKNGVELYSRLYAVWPFHTKCKFCEKKLRMSSGFVIDIFAEFLFGVSVIISFLSWFSGQYLWSITLFLIGVIALSIPLFFGKAEMIESDL